MRFKSALLVLVASLLPSTAAAANREMVELQRDVAALQDQVRALQSTIDQKMGQLQTLMQQTLDTSAKSNTSVAVLESGFRDRLAEQQKILVSPVVSLNSKIDQMTTDFNTMRESVADVAERMNKLQVQITELNNTVRTLNAPPAPPPTAGLGGAGAPPAGVSPKQLYESALRDRSGGNLDLASQGFEEYLRYFGDTDLAPNAQFYVGQIAYDKGDYPAAIRSFDTVLEKYPDNNKTADAMFMKGMALLKGNQKKDAEKEFTNVMQKFPNSEVAAKARTQRSALTSASTPRAAPPSRRRTR